MSWSFGTGPGMTGRGGGGGFGDVGRRNGSASLGGGTRFTGDSFPGLRGGGNNLVNGGDGGRSNNQHGSGAADGLNPNRNRGFGQATMNRASMPSLNDMRARQNAIVAKFMTFFKRKNTLVVELYETAFYKAKPTWDKIADFLYNDLCNTDELRAGLKDVQFHPVKMLLFIKFKDEKLRDETVQRIRSPQGIIWTSYRVKVKGYSLDAEVKFVRLLGVNDETGADEIKKTFSDQGIGEIVDIKKGFVDNEKLPGVTNGIWLLRVKITDPNKVIPSYIHRRDDGELWSLNFEGRVFCCWKCGSGSHIGDKCRDQTRTFEEVFGEVVNEEGEVTKPTWAAVVRSGSVSNEEHNKRVRAVEQRIMNENLRRDTELRKQREDEEQEKIRKEVERQKALEGVVSEASLLYQQQGIVDTNKGKPPEENDELLAETICKTIVEDLVSRATLNQQQGIVKDKPPDPLEDGGDTLLLQTFTDPLDDGSDTLLLQAVADPLDDGGDTLLLQAVAEVKYPKLGQGCFGRAPDPVVEADIRSRNVVQKFLSWRRSRDLGSEYPPLTLTSEKIMNLTLPKNPDLESVFGAGASRLALEFLGPDIAPPSPSEDMVCGTGFDSTVETSDKGGDCFPDQNQLSQVETSEGSWISAPKGKRAMRRERRKESNDNKL